MRACVWCVCGVCAVQVLLLCIIVYYFKGIYGSVCVFVLYCMIVLCYYSITLCEALRRKWICTIEKKI